MRVNTKDLASGAFFVAIGIAYLWMAWTQLSMGTAVDMGPGYFPIVLSSILVLFGAAIAIRGLRTARDGDFGCFPWRAVGMLTLATVVFAAFFERLGMLPGVFVLAFLAALASPTIAAWKAALTSACLAVFCTLVFGYGIGLPVPLVGPLFRF
jgi:hypothetical protein